MFVENAPILPTANMGESIDFWRNFGLMLMFSDADEPGESQHATMTSGALSVHLEHREGNKPASGHGVRVLVSDREALLALYDKVAAPGEITGQLSERSWTRLGFSFSSPEGAEIFCYIDK